MLKDGSGVKAVTRLQNMRGLAIALDTTYVYWYDGSSIWKSLK